jgi:hypothetical protein
MSLHEILCYVLKMKVDPVPKHLDVEYSDSECKHLRVLNLHDPVALRPGY